MFIRNKIVGPVKPTDYGEFSILVHNLLTVRLIYTIVKQNLLAKCLENTNFCGFILKFMSQNLAKVKKSLCHPTMFIVSSNHVPLECS